MVYTAVDGIGAEALPKREETSAVDIVGVGALTGVQRTQEAGCEACARSRRGSQPPFPGRLLTPAAQAETQS